MPLALTGIAALEPVDDVEVVDVLLDDVIAAEPGEVVPVAHLVFHFGQLATVLLLQVCALCTHGVAPFQ